MTALPAIIDSIDTVDDATQLVLVLQVGIAAFLGAFVGVERELAGKSAGVRTHMIVAAAAALAVGLGELALAGRTGDSSRVLHGVITGVGFIGGGTIIHSKKGGTSGITTASTVLLVAVLGAACALGAPILAASVTFLALLTLRGVHALEKRFGALLAKKRVKEQATAYRGAGERDDESDGGDNKGVDMSVSERDK